MKRIAMPILFTLLSICYCKAIFATTYWVDQSAAASDSNPGSETQPWSSLAKALNTATAGDTIKVKKGTYSGVNTPPSRTQKFYRGLTFANSGSASAPIIIEAATPGEVILDQNFQASGFLLDGHQHIIIKGFTITRAYGGGVHVRRGSFITVENNHIYNIDGPKGSNVGGIKFDKCKNCLAANNTIHDVRVNGTYTQFVDGGNSAAIHSYGMSYTTIRNNHLFNSYSGVYHKESSGEKGADIMSNIIHSVTIGFYYNVKGAGSPPHKDQVIQNNVLFNADTGVRVWSHDASGWNTGFRIKNNSLESSNVGIWLDATQDTRVENNIFAHQQRYVIATAATNINRPGKLEVSDNNCFYNIKQFAWHPHRSKRFFPSLGQWTSATNLDQNSSTLTSYPFNTGNYRKLKTNSACQQNRGANITVPVGANFINNPIKSIQNITLEKLSFLLFYYPTELSKQRDAA